MKFFAIFQSFREGGFIRLFFLTPLLVATLLSSPLYFLAKTQGRRVRVTLRSLQCDTPHTGHGREEFRSGPLFICDE